MVKRCKSPGFPKRHICFKSRVWDKIKAKKECYKKKEWKKQSVRKDFFHTLFSYIRSTCWQYYSWCDLLCFLIASKNKNTKKNTYTYGKNRKKRFIVVRFCMCHMSCLWWSYSSNFFVLVQERQNMIVLKY